MSIFNELILPKVLEIQKTYVTTFNDELKAALDSFDKFEEEFQKGRATVRERTLKDKNALTTLQSITEDEDDKPKSTDKPKLSDERSSTESGKENRGSKKRSKNEVDGMSSPEQDKRLKRNASVKAQSIISKQVNVNLTQKLRRENSTEKKSRRGKDDEKENNEPVPVVQIKQEKVSIPPENEAMEMEMESLPVNIPIKQEPNHDDIAMPPPAIPMPKSRKAAQKKKSVDGEEEPKRRSARSKKQPDEPLRASTRSTRASSRATKKDSEEMAPPPAETRPKRTRAKKVTPEITEDAKESQTIEDSSIASPADKRPKRTRRGRKASDKQEPPQVNDQVPEIISPKEERISIPDTTTDSPILQKSINKKKDEQSDSINIDNKPKNKNGIIKLNGIVEVHNGTAINGLEVSEGIDETYVTASSTKALDETRVIDKLNSTVTLSKDLDKTVVLPNGAYNHPEMGNAKMNETVVIEKDNANKQIMDATVVLDKDPKPTNITDDNSLLTDDDSVEEKTPPHKPPPQPTSAVKEKVQQFEEMASRTTRTKTRALAKKEESTENQTPPDKIIPSSVASETLAKMNNLIFKSKMPQLSNSATKPTANTSFMKSQIPTSTSKLSGINKAREAEEQKREKEDARRKKEALLEAKREMHKRKREEKMAAAAAAREAAERERRAALAAAARERQEKQLHADVSKQERLKEVEKKKLEYARKVAETEERRRAEETARQQRLEEEQKRAEDRRKQLEEADVVKKEAALLEREMERKKREFHEKLKMKQKMENEKMSTPQKYKLEPVYMEGGFQYLNSDEEAEPVRRQDPEWSTSKNRHRQASIQDRLKTSDIDKLFSVREQTADLREIFPSIDRARLKRTSSAVWRTPPSRLAALTE